MKHPSIVIFLLLSFFSAFAFGDQKDIELCSIGGLVVQIEGYQPTTNFKKELLSGPCNKISESDFLKIFKIFSSAQEMKKIGYVAYKLLLKAGSFHFYMDDAYVIEINDTNYEITDRIERIKLCNIVGRLHNKSLDNITIEKLCSSTR